MYVKRLAKTLHERERFIGRAKVTRRSLAAPPANYSMPTAIFDLKNIRTDARGPLLQIGDIEKRHEVHRMGGVPLAYSS